MKRNVLAANKDIWGLTHLFSFHIPEKTYEYDNIRFLEPLIPMNNILMYIVHHYISYIDFTLQLLDFRILDFWYLERNQVQDKSGTHTIENWNWKIINFRQFQSAQTMFNCSNILVCNYERNLKTNTIVYILILMIDWLTF